MISLLRRLRRDESGATMIEYGLIAALVSVVAIGALSTLGDGLSTSFESIAGKLTDTAGEIDGGTGGTGGTGDTGTTP
ncbi:Flp family type IVb pilin [Marinivivus vitaminiproducens]|uniref:Flp family type IVb pilin n=1 Tax=Marinivivus vitaminiproducens TaxID=3035935 RepID=UPI0027A67658|nr:Flp family type IVb pilin [Geminicoccaceae bacterium SCSIO 64248]